MSRITCLAISPNSTFALLVISPATTTSPVLMSDSQATRLSGSCASSASSTASEIWSQTLSGWPSLTDSDVKTQSLSIRLCLLGLRAGGYNRTASGGASARLFVLVEPAVEQIPDRLERLAGLRAARRHVDPAALL